MLKPTIYNKIKFGLGKAKISRAFIRLIISENSSSEICTKIDNFFLHQNGVEFGLVSIGRGGKSGGAWEHCSQNEMDRTILGRRIWAKFTALVAIFIKRAIYCTFLVGPMKNRSYFEILKSL